MTAAQVLVVGGAGFIGSNAVARFLGQGHRVAVLDDLSRPGSEDNLAWLRSQGLEDFVRADVRDPDATRAFVAGRPDVELVVHLAAQVAMTVALENPRLDFDVNVAGTLNLLEALRTLPRPGRPPVFVLASTNKVYGGLEDLPLVEGELRFETPAGYPGVAETRPLDPETPHAVAKASAEHYVRAYARSFGIPAVTFRQSCIYGPRQLGLEEQGWVAWLAHCAATGRPVRLFGDGRQVRDLLHVDDLVEAFARAWRRADALEGQAYNVGGGPAHTRSLLELLRDLEALGAPPVTCERHPWRTGDQRVYVSDVRRVRAELGWEPRIGVEEGLRSLWDWVRARASA